MAIVPLIPPGWVMIISGSLEAPADHPWIDFWLVPFCCSAHPALDLGLKLGVVGAEVECVEAVNDIAHQVAHLGVINV